MLDASKAERRDVAVATFAATEGSKVIAELRHHDRSVLKYPITTQLLTNH